jgi:hypothetical protein
MGKMLIKVPPGAFDSEWVWAKEVVIEDATGRKTLLKELF